MADAETSASVQNGSSQIKQAPSQGSTGEMSRPNNLQRIAQKKALVRSYSRTKKLEKLAVYSSCKVGNSCMGLVAELCRDHCLCAGAILKNRPVC